jgi:hypothetical protein
MEIASVNGTSIIVIPEARIALRKYDGYRHSRAQPKYISAGFSHPTCFMGIFAKMNSHIVNFFTDLNIV